MKRSGKTVLFLSTTNHRRGRLAEILFDSAATRLGLPWRAVSKGLALERGDASQGPMAATALAALKTLGIRADEASKRPPAAASATDFDGPDRIVALNADEHRSLLQERFPTWTEKVEFWQVTDGPEMPTIVEREVMGLIARILGGGERPADPPIAEAAPTPKEKVRKPVTVKVGRETKGRRGKGVTTVSEVPLDEAGLMDLAATLKQRCGTGGTVKDGRIEIQGDQRERLIAELEKLGYKAKRVGG